LAVVEDDSIPVVPVCMADVDISLLVMAELLPMLNEVCIEGEDCIINID
jgi:hypothetical protein